MKFDNNLKDFFRVLYREVSDMNNCEANIITALSYVAENLRIAKAELKLNTPKTKLRTVGTEYESVLYDSKSKCGMDTHEFNFKIPDDGNVIIKFTPESNTGFSDEEKDILNILSNAIYIQCSRTVMRKLLLHAINTDLATGASTLEALIDRAGMLIEKNQLELYNIVFFNIHNFKYVNKVLSYKDGDVVLRSYTKHIQDSLSDEEILARLGGDNYVSIVKRENLDRFLDMLSMVSISFKNETRMETFIFGATVGYSSLEGIRSAREVMSRASLAYTDARRIGAGCVVEYTDDIRHRLMKIQSVLSNFIPALKAKEFVVYYQPKVNLNDKTIFGAEALVRWVQNGKVIFSNDFVPMLERDGSIVKLDYYVLEEVCIWLKHRIDLGLEPVRISVNFSRKHLDEKGLIENIVKIIDKYGIDHKYIEIELTESEDYQNFEIIINIVNGLKSNGIITSMDDFGTGFSSLNMIKNVDLQVIKIDKSFIPLETEYAGKDKDVIMFYHIINMVKALGKKTIAEGVETIEQLSYLKEVGCDAVQGYVFDKALPEKFFEKRLAEGYK